MPLDAKYALQSESDEGERKLQGLSDGSWELLVSWRAAGRGRCESNFQLAPDLISQQLSPNCHSTKTENCQFA